MDYDQRAPKEMGFWLLGRLAIQLWYSRMEDEKSPGPPSLFV